MNTFSTSPDLTLSMARYRTTEPVDQTQARATLRAIRAQQRQERSTTWNPVGAFARRFAVLARTVRTTPAAGTSH